MSTPTPPPKPPLTLSPRPAKPTTPPPAPAVEPEGMPTFGTTGVPLATALIRLGVPLLVGAAVVVLSLFSSTLGLIAGGLILFAAVCAVAWPALTGLTSGGGRRPGGSRLGNTRLGRALGGTRLGRALQSAGARGRSGLARARDGRFATGMRRLTGGRFPARTGDSRGSRAARGLPGGSRTPGRSGRGGGLLSRRGSRPGGRAGGRSPLGRFLPRGVSGSRSAHGSVGRSGGRTPGSRRPGGSRGSLLNRATGGRFGSPGTGGRKAPAGGRAPGLGRSKSGPRGGGLPRGSRSPGKAPGKPGSRGGSGGGGSRGKGRGPSSSWSLTGLLPAARGIGRVWNNLGGFVGNRVRGVDGGAVADALAAPLKPGRPKKFTAGIDDDTDPDPVPDWFPGMSAADHDWPEEADHPGASTVDDYAWPKDHDKGKTAPRPHPSPHASPHPPEQHEHHETPSSTTPRRNAMSTDNATITPADLAPFGTHFQDLTEESTAADRRNALNEAAGDASARHLKQVQEAEQLRADARAAVKFPDRVTELNAKAAELEGDAEKNRLLSSHFTTRSAAQTD